MAWAGAALLVTTFIYTLVWLALMVTALLGTRADVAELSALRGESPATITSDKLNRVSASFRSLHSNLTRIKQLTTTPPGTRWLVEQFPWLGHRYASAQSLLQVGLRVSDAGSVGATVGAQSLGAYQSTGLTEPAPAGTLTWLDVLTKNAAELDRVGADVKAAELARDEIDPAILPGSLQAKLTTLDSVLARYDELGITTADDRLALLRSLGSDRPVRYLILFQNPAELRPSGGFPGTMALVTFNRGQLISSQIFDAHTLTDAYIAHRSSKRPEPWPIDHYFPQDGFLLHDAGWYADFPTAASTMMSMYAETDWPPIDGVIAVQPTVAADLLRVTGPLDVNIDGEMRHVTADNVYDEIERQRRLIVEGIKPWDKTRQVHKEALADIGEALLAAMKTANREQLVNAARLLVKSASVRDIQVYAADPKLEALADQHGWTGRIDPSPIAPTLAITFANVTLQKSSEFMHPSLHFTLSPVSSGRRTVTLDITIDNTGPMGEDPLYSGFQTWWIQVGLPAGSQRLSASLPAQPDPAAPNGGTYAVGVNPQEERTVTVVFSIADDTPFLLRRQPGVTNALVAIDDTTCGEHELFSLDRDHIVTLAGLCHP